MRAEYDYTNNRIVAIEQDNGRVAATNNPRVLGARTEWLPVSVVYPDGYDERFMGLLHADSVEYQHDADKNIVIVKYPDADFSADAIRAQLIEASKLMAKNELNLTDWVIVKAMETGTPVPQDIADARAKIRQKSNEMEQSVRDADDADLSDMNVTFGPVPTAEQSPPVDAVEGGDGSEWVTNATAPGEEGKQVRPAKPNEVRARPVEQVATITPTPPKNEDRKDG